ncbi:MAG: hypothetical protein O7F16_09565, partial [Acidobacteria bacterium]|nr:hypothetical protein [Acidobacteriota bacterium]
VLFMHHQLWNLGPVSGNTRQFEEQISPLLEPFDNVYFFAGDSSFPETSEGNFHYHVYANGFRKLGYYLITLDRESGQVQADLVEEAVEPPVIRPSYFVRKVVREFEYLPLSSKLTFGFLVLVVVLSVPVVALRLRRAR